MHLFHRKKERSTSATGADGHLVMGHHVSGLTSCLCCFQAAGLEVGCLCAWVPIPGVFSQNCLMLPHDIGTSHSTSASWFSRHSSVASLALNLSQFLSRLKMSNPLYTPMGLFDSGSDCQLLSEAHCPLILSL